MLEDGKIDGAYIHKLVKMWKPELMDYIRIPSEDFYLCDFVDDALNILFPRG